MTTTTTMMIMMVMVMMMMMMTSGSENYYTTWISMHFTILNSTVVLALYKQSKLTTQAKLFMSIIINNKLIINR